MSHLVCASKQAFDHAIQAVIKSCTRVRAWLSHLSPRERARPRVQRRELLRDVRQIRPRVVLAEAALAVESLPGDGGAAALPEAHDTLRVVVEKEGGHGVKWEKKTSTRG